MSDDRVELKPCPSPWCKESLPELQQGGFRNGHFRVECQTCFTKGPTRDDLNGGGPAAIAAWNTRALDRSIESLQAEVDRKDAALQKIRRTAIKAGLPIVLLQQVTDIARQALAAKEQTRDR